MQAALWQVPMFTLGVYFFYRGAALYFSDTCFWLDCGAKLYLGTAEITRIAPRRSWQRRVLYHAVMAVVAVWMWSSFGK